MAFNILTIGDSVMWGQGNLERDKFSSLVKKRLASDLNQSVRIFNYSHSGACLTSLGDDTDEASVIDLNDISGEMPSQHPSVCSQLISSSESIMPEKINLILLNGGANDLFIADVNGSNPLLNAGSNKNKFIADIQNKCYQDMKSVADLAIKMYPNAKLIIVGYYPIISLFSKATAFIGSLAPGAMRILFLALSRRSTIWVKESNKAFTRVIDEINAIKPNTAAFAKSNIKSKNACFVSFPNINFLWEFTPRPVNLRKYIPSDKSFSLAEFITDTVANDNVAEERIQYSLTEAKSNHTANGIASFSHPNVLGSISISQSIISELQCLGVINKPANQRWKNTKEKVKGVVKSVAGNIKKWVRKYKFWK